MRQTLPVFEDVYRKTGVQQAILRTCSRKKVIFLSHSLVIDNKRGNDSNLLIVFYVQIMPDDFVMQLHR
ncbi:hypothetical protein, partial [Escherichia coli]|uniref:hypothetical protein n=1 Tax=Escherichia coli TaxID=562 RepID=UPI001FCE860D